MATWLAGNSLNSNFEATLARTGALLRKGEEAKGERVESELRILLHEEGGGGRKVDGDEMVGGGWEDEMVAGTWEHQGGVGVAKIAGRGGNLAWEESGQ